MSTAVVVFRRDLRLTDNPALSAACAAHTRILPVFVDSPPANESWPAGAASRWWLHHSLAALQTDLDKCGAILHLYQGELLTTLRKLIAQSGAQAVYWNRLYEPAAIVADMQIKAALRDDGMAVHSFSAALWCEPWKIHTQSGEPYRVFTPFWRTLRQQLQADAPSPQPDAAEWLKLPDALPLSALDLLPRLDWDNGLSASWRPGEAGAHAALKLFCAAAIGAYPQARDLPARHATSRLSPHLHFGEISPRQIHYGLHLHAEARDTQPHPDIEPYLRQLGWREFAHHLLYHFPHTPVRNFNPRFEHFRWAADDPAALRCWQRGRTGIPLVDAGMRELWRTGWMHNRVRMIVASFLTKNLRQHWRHGARWFWDTLVDADLANNTLGWQWVAGCGAGAAPYFRVFNPLSQAKKFDAEGAYLRRWLPELAEAPLDLLHAPWKDPALLRRSGYPEPIVDLTASRQHALSAWQNLSDP